MRPVTWRWYTWEELSCDGLYDLLALRAAVFVVEQDCPYQDLDGQDRDARHLLGRSEDGTLVAYLRAFEPGGVYAEVTIGRVVASGARRGERLGTRLMEEGIRQSQATWGPEPIKLSAQAHLERWYGSLGFVTCGEGYLEDGIPHLPMRRP